MDDLVEKVESSAQSKNEMYRLEVTVSEVRGHLKGNTYIVHVITQEIYTCTIRLVQSLDPHLFNAQVVCGVCTTCTILTTYTKLI